MDMDTTVATWSEDELAENFALMRFKRRHGIAAGVPLEDLTAEQSDQLKRAVQAERARRGAEGWARYWAELKQEYRDRIAAKQEAEKRQREAEAWATFDAKAEATIKHRASADAAMAALAAAIRDATVSMVEAVAAFPGDPSVAPGLFDLPELHRVAEYASARAAHGIVRDAPLAGPAQSALDLIRRVRTAAKAA